MVVMSNGEELLRALREAAAEVSALLRRIDDPRRSRPATSQERRRLADQAERANSTLDTICRDLGAWIADQPDEAHHEVHSEHAERAESPDAVYAENGCADVTRAQDALDRARVELQRSVEAARSRDATWRQIGEALDITAQSAHKRFDPRARQRHAAYMRERNQRRG